GRGAGRGRPGRGGQAAGAGPGGPAPGGAAMSAESPPPHPTKSAPHHRDFAGTPGPALAGHLPREGGGTEEDDPSPPPAPAGPPPGGGGGMEPIAIMGMAGRFPGARTVDELWENLCQGREAIEDLDDGELAAQGVPPALLANPAYVKR